MDNLKPKKNLLNALLNTLGPKKSSGAKSYLDTDKKFRGRNYFSFIQFMLLPKCSTRDLYLPFSKLGVAVVINSISLRRKIIMGHLTFFQW